MKKFFYLAIMALCSAGFVGCSSDDEPENVPTPDPTPEPAQVVNGVYLLNQGNYYNKIEGSLAFVDYADGSVANSIFSKANGQSLGATPQCAVAYGSRLYIGVYESNLIWVVDRATYKSIKQISLATAEGQNPRSMAVKDGKVYVAMYNGYVSRLDTLSMQIDRTVQVGPNPENICIKGDALYVPNSDGMNYPNYGTTASVIDLKKFEVEKTIEVPLNPNKFVTDGQDVYLLCMGNYFDIPSAIYRISDSAAAEKIAEATLVSSNDSKIYYINAPYGAEEIIYSVYDTATKATSPMLKDNGVDSPSGIGVDPTSGNVVISSYPLDNGYANYDMDGYAKVYDAAGNMLHQATIGAGPACIFFLTK